MKKYIIVFIPLIAIIMIVCLTCVLVRNIENPKEVVEEEMFCDSDLVSAEADDEFSENIINLVGDVFIYRGKIVNENYVQYEFVYDHNWTEEDAVRFSCAVIDNASLVEGKAEILVGMRSGSQTIWAFTLDNTSDDSLEQPDYEGFYRLHTYNRLFVGAPSYLQLISSMEEIRKLETTESFMEDSEIYGIDWYEVWPKLEEIIIYPDM